MQLGQSLSASRSILSNQENTATSQEKLSVNQESPAENRMITPTIKELSIQLLQTSSQQLREHISLATMIKQLRELFRTALKLVKLKQGLSANRLIMSPQESTAVSQRKQSENQESPKERIVITPIMKESSMKQNQLFHRTTRNQLREHTSLATTTKESMDLLWIALKLAKLKQNFSVNRLIISPLLEAEITAAFQRKQLENEESLVGKQVQTPTMKES